VPPALRNRTALGRAVTQFWGSENAVNVAQKYLFYLSPQPHLFKSMMIPRTVPWPDRELFYAIGGFDEMLTGRGGIFDLCFRARQAGFSIRLAPACEVYTGLTASVHDPWLDTSNDDGFMHKWGGNIQADEIDHFRRDGLSLAPDGSQRIAMVTPPGRLQPAVLAAAKTSRARRQARNDT